MSSESPAVSRDFRSLAEFQAAYFPDLDAELERTASAPRQVGARLAREVLAEIMRPSTEVMATAAEGQAKPGKS